MRFLIPLLELKSRLEYLDSVFFFLEHGVDSAIIHTLEEYEYPKTRTHDSLLGNDMSDYILTEFERHASSLELSNSTYKHMLQIYQSVQLAIILVKTEVNREFRCLVGDKPLKVISAKKINRFDCMVHVNFD
jgi:hypothetical protein